MPRKRAGHIRWVVLAATLLRCAGDATAPPAGPGAIDPAGADAAPFEDVATAAGLRFAHFNGMSGELYLAEMMGPGAALFDLEGDGDLDVFIVQGRMLGPGKTLDDALQAPRGSLGHRLYRNDTPPGGALRFTDVSRDSGLVGAGYAMGVAAGDYDNDGRVDLYVTAFGDNVLFRNEGEGRFRDVTAAAGAGEGRWSVSAAFVDYDADGWLDLYVGNYLDLTFANHRKCFNVRDDYCSPKAYNPVPDRLLRNRGDGTFEDVSARSRIASEYGGALGVLADDFDGDGRLDLYVANDGLANQLWRNRGDGTFENVALLAGCALNAMGEAEAGMGVDADDVDNDGDPDLFLAHLATETNTLYRNDGRGNFDDATIQAGLGAGSLAFTGFGAGLLDVDHDGLLDILVVNGAVTIVEELALAGDPFPLHQTNQLFRNVGDGRFEDWTARAGGEFARSEVSRGAAFGDVDSDGDTDVLVLNNNGPARLLLNRVGQRAHWIGLQPTRGTPARDALGARVELVLEDGSRLRRRVHSDGSYASASDPRVSFGLGSRDSVREVRVRWVEGDVETWPAPVVDRWHRLQRGTGRPAD